jgi:pyrophosphatase PpaX
VSGGAGGASSLDTFLFDLDGTLIDSVALIHASYRHALATHGHVEPPYEEWLAGLGTPLAQQFARFASDPRAIDALCATYREHNLRHHDGSVRAYDGIAAALSALRARGLRLGVVTSKRSDGARRGLALCGLASFFDDVVALDDVEKHKPDPEPVLAALARLDARAGRTIYIGDSTHDLAAGRAAGVRTGAALWGPFPRAWLAHEEPDVWLALPGDIARLT